MSVRRLRYKTFLLWGVDRFRARYVLTLQQRKRRLRRYVLEVCGGDVGEGEDAAVGGEEVGGGEADAGSGACYGDYFARK